MNLLLSQEPIFIPQLLTFLFRVIDNFKVNRKQDGDHYRYLFSDDLLLCKPSV